MKHCITRLTLSKHVEKLILFIYSVCFLGYPQISQNFTDANNSKILQAAMTPASSNFRLHQCVSNKAKNHYKKKLNVSKGMVLMTLTVVDSGGITISKLIQITSLWRRPDEDKPKDSIQGCKKKWFF